jgi:RNA polymerase subunit RPABC4/transcription elongation factor Spt4
MEGYRKTGFEKFLETKFAVPVGMVIASGISFLLFTWGFVDTLGGLCVGILSYIVLRHFRVKKIQYFFIFATLMLVVFSLGLYTLPVFSVPADESAVDVILSLFVTMVLPFMLISTIVWYMRQNLERYRKELEAEGRLYPPGYGRCKRCSTVVLPGEVCCRRCGEIIDVPDELKVKKVNYFECSECNREVPEDAGVCPYCGETFDEETEED